MSHNNITVNNKLIAEFMEFIYIPYNNLQGYSIPGWWKDLSKFNPKVHSIVKNHLTKIGRGYHICRSSNELKYHKSWNWLIPVIQKINLNDTFDKLSTSKQQLAWASVISLYAHQPIEDLYETVVKFITLYNTPD